MIDHGLARGWLAALSPPPEIAPTNFAEREIVLPGSANALPGPLRLASYQREPLDALADPSVDILVLCFASQTGKSTIVNAGLGWGIACSPGPMLHVSPTGGRSEEYVRERFDPLVNASPALRALVGQGQSTRKGSSGGINSVTAKTFPGGQLSFASSYQPDQLAARAVKHLYIDEADRFAKSAGIEGDPIALALKRTRTFEGRGRKVIIVSTPTTRIGSRINDWFLRGDQRRFVVTCPDCGHRATLSFDNLKWEAGKPEGAHLVCEDCGVVQTEEMRRTMVATGAWEATAKGEPGIRSYHLNELASEFSTLASVAQQFEGAKTPEQKQAFYNTVLAEVFDASTEVELSASDLEQNAVAIIAPYADDILFVTAGVDVQGDRVELTYTAHHADGSDAVLNHLRIPGDTSGSSVWQELDSALGVTFPRSRGSAVSVAATLIDSGFSTERVLAFVSAQRQKGRRVYPCRGRSGFDLEPISFAKNGGPMRRAIVGVDVGKWEVQRRLSQYDSQELPALRLPAHLGLEYFEGVASEELRVRYVKGVPRHEYHRVRRRNEPLDCLVYSLAMGKLLTAQQAARKAVSGPPEAGRTLTELGAKLNARH